MPVLLARLDILGTQLLGRDQEGAGVGSDTVGGTADPFCAIGHVYHTAAKPGIAS